jgi:hypothetical protein
VYWTARMGKHPYVLSSRARLLKAPAKSWRLQRLCRLFVQSLCKVLFIFTDLRAARSAAATGP